MMSIEIPLPVVPGSNIILIQELKYKLQSNLQNHNFELRFTFL